MLFWAARFSRPPEQYGWMDGTKAQERCALANCPKEPADVRQIATTSPAPGASFQDQRSYADLEETAHNCTQEYTTLHVAGRSSNPLQHWGQGRQGAYAKSFLALKAVFFSLANQHKSQRDPVMSDNRLHIAGHVCLGVYTTLHRPKKSNHQHRPLCPSKHPHNEDP